MNWGLSFIFFKCLKKDCSLKQFYLGSIKHLCLVVYKMLVKGCVFLPAFLLLFLILLSPGLLVGIKLSQSCLSRLSPLSLQFELYFAQLSPYCQEYEGNEGRKQQILCIQAQFSDLISPSKVEKNQMIYIVHEVVRTIVQNIVCILKSVLFVKDQQKIRLFVCVNVTLQEDLALSVLVFCHCTA